MVFCSLIEATHRLGLINDEKKSNNDDDEYLVSKNDKTVVFVLP